MDPVLLHLLLILAGVGVALGSLSWFARVTGGLFSFAGLLVGAFLAVALFLVLAGFGVVAFPGAAA